MPELQNFDTNVYFRVVADNLLKSFGERALIYAEGALQKMRDMGDDEGFELWRGVHGQIEERIVEIVRPTNETLH